MDFVLDGLPTGRAVRVLTIVDSYTRECLAIEVDSCLSSRRVTRALEWIIQQRGAPERLRCDNGPEFTSRHFLGWCEERRIQLIHIQPARPMQNRRIESFNGRLRDECLNANWLQSTPTLAATVTKFSEGYSTYLGGPGSDVICGLSVDTYGNARFTVKPFRSLLSCGASAERRFQPTRNKAKRAFQAQERRLSTRASRIR